MPPADPPESHPADHVTWRSRGCLPHWDQPGLTQAITFRLADAIPTKIIKRWQCQFTSPVGRPEPTSRVIAILHQRIEEWADRGHGGCQLQLPAVARAVENALLAHDDVRYRLLAWTVMPNHVHVIVETIKPWRIADIVQGWKSWAAHTANRILGRRGRLWQREYFDRAVLTTQALTRALDYVEQNPVRAGLCLRPEDWPHGSAMRRRR